MWWLLLVLWLILLVQIRIRSLYQAAAVYFLQAAVIFGLCAYEAFQGTLSGWGRFSWLGLGLLMVAVVPAVLMLMARKEAGEEEPRTAYPSANGVSVAAALGMGLAYILLDSLLPFAVGRDYMATGAAFFLAGMGMILLSAGKTARLIGLCSVGNGLFLTCFLLFQAAEEIMQGMLLIQVILAAVVLGLVFRREQA